jgi:hypothetical protein
MGWFLPAYLESFREEGSMLKAAVKLVAAHLHAEEYSPVFGIATLFNFGKKL